MLFNSGVFVFVFLPITLAGYYLLNAQNDRRWPIAWLVAASAIFYGWFSIRYLAMLAVLVLLNYAIGILLARDFRAGRRRLGLLTCGIVFDLAVLGYFKYTNFFIENANALFGADFVLQKIILPIGISFFTFQKIAYLVDAYRGEAEEYNLLDFSLFVMYFPQLIAGPIVHHKEMIPQFLAAKARRFTAEDLAAGLALFTIGLVKKIAIADALVTWSDPVFANAQAGHLPTLYAAWTGILSFTLQIYFDFSAYTDMALGLALMVGIRLPLNFDSPYKAVNIVEFWRSWHMTLSRFLRDYVYIPLGGNRRGPRRRYINLVLTMLIGGLWHGAAWTFVAWGALHGVYLVINHGWHHVGAAIRLPWRGTAAGRWIARLITFAAVVLAWVFFRVESFTAAVTMFSGLVRVDHVVSPTETSYLAQNIAALFGFFGIAIGKEWLATISVVATSATLLILLVGVFVLPNSQQLLASFRPALQLVHPSRFGQLLRAFTVGRPIFAPDSTIRLNVVTGLTFAVLLLATMLAQSMSNVELHPFIYFQF